MHALSLALLLAATACAANKAASTLTIVGADAHPDADVFVDGEYIGQVDEVSGSLRLAAGEHRVEVRKSGHFPVQATVRVAARHTPPTTAVEAELLPDPR